MGRNVGDACRAPHFRILDSLAWRQISQVPSSLSLKYGKCSFPLCFQGTDIPNKLFQDSPEKFWELDFFFLRLRMFILFCDSLRCF